MMQHHETGMATGSAFVQFKIATAAQKCMEAAQQGTEPGVQYKGQRLKVTMALPRGKMNQICQEKSEKHEKQDKRNLFLAKEGSEFLNPTSPSL